MSRGVRAVVALVAAFAVYRLLIEVMPSGVGLAVSVLAGVGAYVGAWLLTARWGRQAGSDSRR